MSLSWAIVVVLILLAAGYKIMYEGLRPMPTSADRVFGVLAR